MQHKCFSTAHKEVRHVGDEVDELTAPEIILPDVSPFMKGVSPSRDCIDIHVGIVTQCKKQPPANKFARVCVLVTSMQP